MRYGAAMGRKFELMVKGEGFVPHAVPVGKEPLSIGRGGRNDLVVNDKIVSWEHLKLWADGTKCWLTDVGSTNGTLVNGAIVKGTVALEEGDVVSIGPLALTVVSRGEEPEPGEGTAIAVEEVASGLTRSMRDGRFVVGSAPDVDLRIPGVAPYLAEIAVHGPGDCMLVMGNDDYPLEIGEEVEVGGLRLRLVHTAQAREKTLQPTADRFPYAIEASLDGPTGPYALVSNLRTGESCRIEAETRAILFYLLAQRIEHDRAQEPPPPELGWVPDEEVIVGVWGRSGLADGANRLKVLVHRLRAEVKKAGFDPWLIERRRRFIRIRVRKATVQ